MPPMIQQLGFDIFPGACPPCGNIIETGSTKKDITVEICSKCHPFYTGKQKLVDTSGRVDKFNKKYGIK